MLIRGGYALGVVVAAAAACAGGRVRPLPAPHAVVVMAAALEHIRLNQPHGALALALGPTRLNFDTVTFRYSVSSLYGLAQESLVRQGGRETPLGLDSLAGVPVRAEGTWDRFDVTTMLLVRFTPVGIDDDSSRAVVVVTLDCGTSCGSTAVLLVNRTGGRRWVVDTYRELGRR